MVSYSHRSPQTRFLRHIGMAATLAVCFARCLPAAQNSCDLDQSGSVTFNEDALLAVNMTLGLSPCSASIEGAATCTVITVQRVVNAYLGKPCSVYNAHGALLNWTASTTAGAQYNVYRATSSAGPFTTALNASPLSATTYTDSTVQAGQTYYYVVTAIANGIESTATSPIQAKIPSP